MISVEQHCLFRDKKSSNLIRFAANQGVFGLPDADILIVWKGNTGWMPAKQIGDAMQVPLVYDRPYISTIDWEWVVRGLSVYQSYDEDDALWKTYLWKYAGGEPGMHAIHTMSNTFHLPASVHKEGKYVVVRGCPERTRDNEPVSLAQAVGLLIGIALGYGTPKTKSDQLLTAWQVNVPCLGEVMRHEALFTHLQEVCSTHGLFWIHREVHQRDLTVWHRTIHDPELVAFLRAIWTNQLPPVVMHFASERLVIPILATMGKNSNSVLKFIMK